MRRHSPNRLSRTFDHQNKIADAEVEPVSTIEGAFRIKPLHGDHARNLHRTGWRALNDFKRANVGRGLSDLEITPGSRRLKAQTIHPAKENSRSIVGKHRGPVDRRLGNTRLRRLMSKKREHRGGAHAP